MPTYEYVCKNCGHLFEIVQSMRDDPLTECPECGGELRKVFAPVAIAFKGSGFYATDHGRNSKSASERSDSKDKSASPSGDKKAPDKGPEKGSDKGSDKGPEKSSDKALGSDKGSDKGAGSSAPKDSSSKGDTS